MNLRQLLFLKASGGSAPSYENLLNAQYIKKQASSQLLIVERGSVTDPAVSGGNSDYVQFGQYFPAGTYTMSCKISGAGISGARFLSSAAFSGGTYNSYYGGYFADMTNGQITFTTSEGFGVGFVFITGTEDSEGAIYDIMFEEGDTAHAYYPYIPVNLNHTPYLPIHTESGVTFTRNEDWSIRTSGSPTESIFYPLPSNVSNRFPLKAGTYTFGTGFSGAMSLGCFLYENKDDPTPSLDYHSGVYPSTFTIANDMWAIIRFAITDDATGVDGKTFYIMLNEGSALLPYTKPDM